MSVFQRLKSKVSNHATIMSPDSLERGVLYPVTEFRLRQSDFLDKKGNYPTNLLAYFSINELKYYMTCPALYNGTSSEDVEEMNAEIRKGKVPSICYYGKDGKRNDVLIHPHGEGVDEKRLEEFTVKMNDTPTKATSGTSATPTKATTSGSSATPTKATTSGSSSASPTKATTSGVNEKQLEKFSVNVDEATTSGALATPSKKMKFSEELE
ncbi:UPF0182 protein [Frankliniella fusca]|uniref:UPF0182 protein n=1 Tax=Frankliniella fusca TaxID=407009 RepID=A0AAE1LH40_9NEOP|nr:UPF0182 protein [Frankliniella fusca]